jgi:DNA-binding MarR family transcriptional regulator
MLGLALHQRIVEPAETIMAAGSTKKNPPAAPGRKPAKKMPSSVISPWARVPETRQIATAWLKERPDIKEQDIYRLMMYIMSIGRAMSQSYDVNCRQKCGINTDEMRVLFALRRVGPPYTMRATDLYLELCVTSGAITKQVNRLVDRGLAVRTSKSDGINGRSLIKITPKGLKLTDVAATLIVDLSPFAAAAAALTKAERQNGLEFFDQVLESLKNTLSQ